MDVLNRLALAGVVPVVVLENAKDAVPTAKAMVAGGIDVMEITFRTAAAADSIKAVSEGCPEMLVGAGTVSRSSSARRPSPPARSSSSRPALTKRSCAGAWKTTFPLRPAASPRLRSWRR